MSDNYSIDDILAEIDRKRGGGSKSTESVTEIISETELHSAMNSTSHTRMPSAEESEPVSGDEEARERAESIRRAAEANRRKAENKRREREERQQEQRRLEQERAEQEQRMQFSEPEKPAEPEHSGYTSELSSPTEAAKLFGEAGASKAGARRSAGERVCPAVCEAEGFRRGRRYRVPYQERPRDLRNHADEEAPAHKRDQPRPARGGPRRRGARRSCWIPSIRWNPARRR